MTIASLMVRLGIEGADSVKRGLSDTKHEIREVDSSARHATPSLESMSRALGAMAKTAAMFGAAGIAGLGVGMAAGSKSALELSIQFENVTARLTALTGSAQVAAEKLKFVQQVAAPSNFTFSQLADASVQLEAFGLRTERVLPSIAKLGMAFAADTEHLQMLTRMFGALAQGNFPDLEQLTAFGLSRAQFRDQGIQFDGQGKLLSSARDTMDALERIVNQKYGKIFETMGQTTGAKLASLADAWERFQATIGDGIARNLTPVVERLTESISRLVDSGVLADVVTKLADSLAGLSALSSQDGMNQFVARAASFVSMVPEMLSYAALAVRETINTIGDGISLLFQRLGNTLAVGAKTAMESAGFAFRALFAGMEQMGIAFAKSEVGKGVGAAIGVVSASAPDMFGREGEFLARMSGANPTMGLPVAGGDWGKVTAEESEKQTETLKSIERSSRESADALNLRRQTLGGGALAALGVTAAELQGRASRNARRPGFANTNTPGRGVEAEIRRLIDQSNRTVGPSFAFRRA